MNKLTIQNDPNRKNYLEVYRHHNKVVIVSVHEISTDGKSGTQHIPFHLEVQDMGALIELLISAKKEIEDKTYKF